MMKGAKGSWPDQFSVACITPNSYLAQANYRVYTSWLIAYWMIQHYIEQSQESGVCLFTTAARNCTLVLSLYPLLYMHSRVDTSWLIAYWMIQYYIKQAQESGVLLFTIAPRDWNFKLVLSSIHSFTQPLCMQQVLLFNKMFLLSNFLI